ncbi:MAG: glycosyltransferase family 4 protein, partial [Opitutales bacterium]
VARWFFIMGRAAADHESLHCVTEPAPVLALLWRIILRRRIPSNLIILLHGTEILRWRRRKWLVRAIRALARKSRLLVPSVCVSEMIAEVLGPGFASPEVLPYAPPKFCYNNSGRKQTKPDASLTLLTVARIHPRKGQLDVVKALQKVNPALTHNIRYRIVGDGRKSRRAYLAALRKAADQAPFEVTEEGPKYGEDLIRAYCDSDVFVMASRDDPDSLESFGLVYLEAASFGLPILATRVGGVAEACSEGALLAEPHSEDALVEGLERLLSDANLRRSLGEAGARRTRAMNWNAAASLLLGETNRASLSPSPTQ